VIAHRPGLTELADRSHLGTVDRGAGTARGRLAGRRTDAASCFISATVTVSDRIITAFSTGTAGQAEVRAVEGVDEEVLEPDSPIFPRWSDMRNVLIGLGVLTALAQNVQTASAQGTTSIKIVEATAAGTGPYTITSEGLVSIKIGEVFMGVQYQVLDLPQAALLTSASPTSPMVRPSLAWKRK
jgi:hypothetical protein